MNNQEVLAGKRVLFVLCGFDLGGAERQSLHFARYLKNLGCDVRVWGHHHHKAGPELVIDHCEAAGIPWAVYKFRWPCRKTALVRDGWRLLRGLYRERPDVILSYTTWPNIGCGLTWRLSPAKACIWGQRDIRLHGDIVERFACRLSSAVICNAAHEVGYLRRTLGEIRTPVHVVHNGIDLAPCQKPRAEWRVDLGIDEDAPVATMLANFRSGKDHPTLLHAWRKVLATISKGQTRPRLLLAGAHQESYAAVHQLAKDLDLLDSVSFPGQVKDVAGLLAASDIGILATADEGLPNAVLEYMASGLPVVATDVPGNREALGDDPQQPLCKPGDPDSLAARLQILLHDADLRRRLGARNRQQASEEFSIDRMCKTMAGIVGDLLNVVPARA
jgi:glycosyltransferase involved in cell wall biosynthesis